MTEPTPSTSDPAAADLPPRRRLRHSLSFTEKVARGEFLLLSGREQIRLGLIILVMLGVALWMVFAFIEPPPPRLVRIATGAPGGAYASYARQYAVEFAKHGVKLEVVNTAGSIENLARLDDLKGRIDLAFVQGGVSSDAQHPGVLGLASVAYEPIWFFYDKKRFAGAPPPTRLRDFVAHSLAIDVPGSGVRAAATQLLAMNHMSLSDDKLVALGGMNAVDAMLAGKLDAAIVVAAADAPVVVKALAHDLGVMNLEDADAYVRLLPWLAKVDLPRGVADIGNDIPHERVVLIAAVANLVARADLHHAIMFLALDIASTVNSRGTAVNAQNQFPSEQNLDYAESDESKRFFKSGRPFLQQYLPFWLANLAERLIAVLLPLLAISLPLMRVIPALLNWRVRAKLSQLYEEVSLLETRRDASDAGKATNLARLAQIDRLVSRLDLGAAHHAKVYFLKSHIDLVRSRLSAAASP
jgi:TRAP-type uncharacterized transport system substrate-binding protein